MNTLSRQLDVIEKNISSMRQVRIRDLSNEQLRGIYELTDSLSALRAKVSELAGAERPSYRKFINISYAIYILFADCGLQWIRCSKVFVDCDVEEPEQIEEMEECEGTAEEGWSE